MRNEAVRFVLTGVVVGFFILWLIVLIMVPHVHISDVLKLTKQCEKSKKISPPVPVEKLTHSRRVDYLKVCLNKALEEEE